MKALRLIAVGIAVGALVFAEEPAPPPSLPRKFMNVALDMTVAQAKQKQPDMRFVRVFLQKSQYQVDLGGDLMHRRWFSLHFYQDRCISMSFRRRLPQDDTRTMRDLIEIHMPALLQMDHWKDPKLSKDHNTRWKDENTRIVTALVDLKKALRTKSRLPGGLDFSLSLTDPAKWKQWALESGYEKAKQE